MHGPMNVKNKKLKFVLEKLGVKVWAFVTKLIHLVVAFKLGKLFKHRTYFAVISLFMNRLLSELLKFDYIRH